ncbi:EamA family transporter [Lysinimonas soli]|uniref:EamA family transporter n=1 Tax=Lysinimonas soli TaxID=1074233 RepID=A0ABW0NTA0_9MICO
MIALLGLSSALVYGASDFLGGLASRRMTSLLVSLLSQLAALLIVTVVTVSGSGHWSASAVLLGAVAGVAGGIGTWAFYASLAIGPMSVVSPGVAMIYAVVPAIVGFAIGERIAPLGYVALAAVVVAAVLLAVPRQRDPVRVTPRAVVLGSIAGIGFAGYIIAIGRTPRDSGLAPLLVDLCVATLLYGTVLLVNRVRRGRAELAGLGDRLGVVQAVLAGILLALGNILLVVGLHLGDLAVMGVLNALYPLGTVILAFFVLRERLSVLQAVGIVLALAASAVLAVV